MVDCSYLYDKSRFLSAVMLSLSAIIGLEMPFINVISKIDLLRNFGRPDMHLTFYGNLAGLEHMFYFDKNSDNEFERKYGKLTSSLSQVIENYGLVGYSLLDI